MKRTVLSLVILVAFALSGVSQSINPPVLTPVGDKVSVEQHIKAYREMRSQSKDPLGWVVPTWDLLENYYGTYDDVTGYANVIFPDSTTIYESNGNWTYNWMHGFGQTFDPHALIFDPDLFAPLVMPGTPYNVDSLQFYGWYSKYVPVNDTLLIEIIHGAARTAPNFRSGITFTSNGFQLSPPFVSSTSAQYGPEARLASPTKTVFKHVLTDADSTMGGAKRIAIPLNVAVGANEIVGVHVSYISGSAYTLDDPMYSYTGTYIPNPTMNAFRVGFYGADGNLKPLYFAFEQSTFGENLSYYVSKGTRYQTWTAGDSWRNEVMAGLGTWGFHIGYHVSVNTGIEKIADNMISISQNQPNPFSDFTSIKYSLSETADVTFDLYDQTGRKVMNIKRGFETPGNHTIEIDAANLQNGIYFYTLTAGNHKASKKMVVVK